MHGQAPSASAFDLRGMFARDAAWAHRYLLEHGSISTQFRFYAPAPDGRLLTTVLPTPERDIDAFRAFAATIGATCVSFFAEAWMLRVASDAPMPSVFPASSDRRIEALLVAVAGHDGLLSSLRRIIRNEAGRAIDLGPDEADGATMHGWLREILPARSARSVH
jgi:hypothetical protein